MEGGGRGGRGEAQAHRNRNRRMCGIIAMLLADASDHVAPLIVDGLTVLQHRGQDAAGIVTSEDGHLSLRKDNGLVSEVFQQHHMVKLRGNRGLGHVRYPTAGSSSCAEAQPLFTNYPYGICAAHNGNLTNTDELRQALRKGLRHINTDSDSELLMNVFAEELQGSLKEHIQPADIFEAVRGVMNRCRGAYGVVMLISDVGLLAFRDPHGIRPLVLGSRASPTLESGRDYILASESVAIDTLRFDLEQDVGAGEAVLIMGGQQHDGGAISVHRQVCSDKARLTPCIFEFVYFARPDSIMDGVQVYQARLNMGEALAHKILRVYPDHDIDVVIPVPDTSRTSALQCAYTLNRPFREGFIKNRYIARTFIMPGQAMRSKTIRMKLNTIRSEFRHKNVLLVDDSIVRGTTSRELVSIAREAGARKVYLTSAAPPVVWPNVYGIDIPTRSELIAYGRNEEEVAQEIGADWVVYQDLSGLKGSIRRINPELTDFDSSCFDGVYVTGDEVSEAYLDELQKRRGADRQLSPKSPAKDKAQAHGNEPNGTSSSNGTKAAASLMEGSKGHADVSCEYLHNQT